MSTDRRDSAGQRPWREFARFIVFGVVNLIFTYLIYLGLHVFLSYPAAYTGSYVCGILISYVLNARFVFKEKLRVIKALQYPIVYVSQYLIGMALLYVLVEMGHVSSSLAPLVIPVVTVPATFVLSRYLIKGLPFRSR